MDLTILLSSYLLSITIAVETFRLIAASPRGWRVRQLLYLVFTEPQPFDFALVGDFSKKGLHVHNVGYTLMQRLHSKDLI